jgi:hypothetical protein
VKVRKKGNCWLGEGGWLFDFTLFAAKKEFFEFFWRRVSDGKYEMDNFRSDTFSKGVTSSIDKFAVPHSNLRSLSNREAAVWSPTNGIRNPNLISAIMLQYPKTIFSVEIKPPRSP